MGIIKLQGEARGRKQKASSKYIHSHLIHKNRNASTGRVEMVACQRNGSSLHRKRTIHQNLDINDNEAGE